MRKVTFAVLAITALLVGCTSIDCSMNNLVMNHSAFIKHRENSSDTIAKLDGYYVTVSTLNTDSSKEVVLVNRDFEPSELRMLMSSILEDETLYFDFQDTLGNTPIRDEVHIAKTNELVFEGVDCTPRYHHKVLSVTTTNNLIDSITVNNDYIDNDPNKVHFHIFVHPSD
jgi:hypothetical protein